MPFLRLAVLDLAAAAAVADVLLASSTVRESIMIAALLKLSRGMAYAEKVERVEAILKELVSTSSLSTACPQCCLHLSLHIPLRPPSIGLLRLL